MLRLTLRNLLARKVRLLMSALAIVLGIGFLAGVLTFSNGLGSTFDGIIKGSTPDALVRPAGTESFEQFGIGNTTTLTPEVVDELAALPEVAQADGNVDGLGMYLLDQDGKLVGGGGAPTIAFNYSNTPNLLDEPSLELVSGDWPEGPTDVVLDTGAAENAGYAVGDDVAVIAPSGDSIDNVRKTLTMTGTAEFNGGGTAGATLLVFSTRGAQELFLEGRDVFTSAALTAAPGVTQAELVEAAGAVLPATYEAVEGDTVAKESQDAVGEFLDVISTFLIAFAVIAILVGGFIIANTFNILVAQRVRELALLRAIGASASQVRRSVLIEATLMALIGSSLGIVVGLGLARALAGLFRSFGLDINSSALELTPGTLVLAYGVGLGVTLVSAYLPARRASRIAPVAAMREENATPAEGSLRRRGLIGAAVALLGAMLAALGLLDAPRPGRRVDRRRRRAVDPDRRRAEPGARPPGAGRVPRGLRPALRHHRPARGREHAAQPAPHRRHRVGADDRPGAGLGGRHPRRVDERDDRRAGRGPVRRRLPGAVGELPDLPDRHRRRHGRGRRRRGADPRPVHPRADRGAARRSWPASTRRTARSTTSTWSPAPRSSARTSRP